LPGEALGYRRKRDSGFDDPADRGEPIVGDDQPIRLLAVLLPPARFADQ
jgi:hypothetical protein